jgi:Zn-dependent protease with chaperone function
VPAQAYAQEVQKAREAGKLNTNPALTARVRNIAQRLIPATATFRPDAPGWNWEINTLTTSEMNAYAMPGGKIMVYSGLVDRLKLTDAELAAVIGHEISHALREHTRERVSRAYAQQLALTGIAVATGAGQGTLDLANTVAASRSSFRTAASRSPKPTSWVSSSWHVQAMIRGPP